MDWFSKQQEKEKAAAPVFVKTENHCEVDGCQELKAPGQNHVCTKHCRSN